MRSKLISQKHKLVLLRIIWFKNWEFRLEVFYVSNYTHKYTLINHDFQKIFNQQLYIEQMIIKINYK